MSLYWVREHSSCSDSSSAKTALVNIYFCGVLMNRMIKVILVAFFVICSAVTNAQESRTVRIIVPFPAGATLDAMARLLAPRMKEKLGYNFVVENRAGAGGNVGADWVSRQPPDGNTLLFTAPATLVVNKQLYPKTNFDYTSFTPVSLVAGSAFVWFVRPELPIYSMKDLVAYSKTNPKKLSFGSMGIGTASHLILAAFNPVAGTDVLHVPYLGAAPALTALLGGQVDMMVNGLTSTQAHISAGKLRPIGITSLKRHPKLPTVPTLVETFPDLPSTGNWFAFLAPKGLPVSIAENYAVAVMAILAEPDVIAAMDKMGVDPYGSSATDLMSYMEKQARIWSAVAIQNRIIAE